MSLPQSNYDKIKAAIRMLLEGLGENPDREGLIDTPDRVARMYSDVLDGRFSEPDEPTAFEEESYGHIVAVHHVPFYAFCEHHMAVFMGHFGMAYVPDKKVVGLSKMVRLFRHGAKRVTIQERLTTEAADLMMDLVKPKGVIVYANAEHTCMSLRGVKSPGSRTTTIAYRGLFEKDIELRQQFLQEAR